MANAVLEWVGDPAIVPADPRLAVDALGAGFAATAVELPLENILVLGEQDMATGFVERELAVLTTFAQAAGPFGLFEHGYVVPVGREHAGQGTTGDAST